MLRTDQDDLVARVDTNFVTGVLSFFPVLRTWKFNFPIFKLLPPLPFIRTFRSHVWIGRESEGCGPEQVEA